MHSGNLIDRLITMESQIMVISATVVFIWLLYLRIATAIIDMRFGMSLSPVVSIATLGALCLVFLTQPKYNKTGLGLFWAFVVIDLIAIISMFAQPMRDGGEALSFVLVTLLYAMTALMAGSLFSTQLNIRRLFKFCIWYLLVGAGMSFMQVITGTGLLERGTGLMRAYGIGFHPVDYGMQIVIVMVLAEVCRMRSGVRASSLYKLAIGASVLALYLTEARTAWVMLAFVLFAYFYSRSKALWKLVSVSTVAIMIVGLVAFTDRFADLMSLPVFIENTKFDSNTYQFELVDSSMAWRIANWAIHYRIAWESPLIGYGPGQAPAVSVFNLEMHNAFLEYFIELGLLGVAALAALVISAFRLVLRSKQVLIAYRGGYALVSSLAAIVFISMSLSVGFLDQTAATIFFILTLIVGAVPIAPADEAKNIERRSSPIPAFA